MIPILVLSLLFLLRAPAGADFVQDLESGDLSGLESMAGRAEADPERRRALAALRAFYSGRLREADSLIAPVSGSAAREFEWLKPYLRDLLVIREEMQPSESEHFVLWTKTRDRFLARRGLEALEAAYERIGQDLGVYPKEKIPVEIHRTETDFSLASTLDQETLDRSGAVGICKFRRLMILSPEQLAFGYRWLDTLSHEYAHYAINAVSRARCPLWLHEGIARYLDTRWRLDRPAYLSPGNRTELARAAKEDRLIPFARMEPSMVYLDNQDQVRLAFSQVAHAVHMIAETRTLKALREVLSLLAEGQSRQASFRTALGLGPEDFEASWKDFLIKEGLEETPGASPDRMKIGKEADEVEELASVPIRGHIRLGDRMRQAGQMDAAKIQYERALKKEPSNPVALTKLARTLLALRREGEAISLLEACIRDNPNYAPGFLLLGEKRMERQDWAGAAACFEEAQALNPFNPAVSASLAEIYGRLGRKLESDREAGIYRVLTE